MSLALVYEAPIRVAALDRRRSRSLLAHLEVVNRILKWVVKDDGSPATALAIANRCEELCPQHPVPDGKIEQQMELVRQWKEQALALEQEIAERRRKHGPVAPR